LLWPKWVSAQKYLGANTRLKDIDCIFDCNGGYIVCGKRVMPGENAMWRRVVEKGKKRYCRVNGGRKGIH
jgi:hypothetical protein